MERDRYSVPAGRYEPDRIQAIPVEGRVSRSAYRINAPGASVAGVIERYRERLAARGFEPLFQCRERDCGGFDFRFGIELLPAPAMLMDTADFGQLSMAAPDGRWASVLASRVMDAIHVQTVMVEGEVIAAPSPEPRPPRISEPRETVPSPDRPAPIEAVIARRRAEDYAPPASDTSDQTAPEPVEPADPPEEEPEDLAAVLSREGHAVLEGVAFEPGGAALSSGSAAVLDRVAAALTESGEERLAVVGHSDATGALGPNIALSERRADAVRQALVERGVAPGRLEAHGAGWLAPRAPNSTPAGREQNRRVELVVLP